jgi:hypothetical protein
MAVDAAERDETEIDPGFARNLPASAILAVHTLISCILVIARNLIFGGTAGPDGAGPPQFVPPRHRPAKKEAGPMLKNANGTSVPTPICPPP